jgi:predicted ATPase
MREVSLTFEPLTILVGPNASGKSTLLAALTPGIAWGGVDDKWQRREDVQVGIEVTLENGKTHGMPLSGYQYRRFHLDLTQLRQRNMVTEEFGLAPNGANLANVFGTLTRKEQTEVARQFSELVPMFDDVDVRPENSGNHQILFHDRWADVWYAPAQVSDGSMFVLALLLIQHERVARSMPRVVAIEEPERGLHPWLLGEILKVLRAMTRGELGGAKTQIILASHSAELLEFVQPEEVRFFRRDTEDGSVRVTQAPTKSPEWRAAFDEYRGSLGEAWLSGGLGGVPGA